MDANGVVMAAEAMAPDLSIYMDRNIDGNMELTAEEIYMGEESLDLAYDPINDGAGTAFF
jgi:hypothetical protein